MTVDYSWADEPAVREDAPAETEEARRHRLAVANDRLGHAMLQIQQGLADLSASLATAMEAHTDTLDYVALADTAAWLQARKAELVTAEGYVARELGRLEGCPDTVTLTDGRRADVMKGKDRKEWRHDDWKRDVRTAVLREHGLDAVTDVVDAGGSVETVNLADMLAAVQAVHGSAAPKTTALKPLGLSADDYCTSYPGPYSVRISAPETTQE